MIRSRIVVVATVVSTLLLPAPSVAQQSQGDRPSGRLVVVWTSADPDVADKVCLMYTHAAKGYGWFDEVRLVVWGPSQRLLAGSPELQDKIREMQSDGVIVEACVACAKKLGLVERLRELGLEVLPMGVPLTEALKDPETHVLTF